VATPTAFASTTTPTDGRLEVALDMDRDGKSDRAVLVSDPDNGTADLSIYLAAGDGALDPSRQPTLFKNDMPAEGIVSMEGNDKGSLLITYGCGGCSNDFETTLTIVYRDGDFLVAGYTYDWDTRYSAGSCDINYLTGKGFMQKGIDGEAVPLKGTFRPVKLADWSDDDRPRACDLE
jgi:hypothetical protein